ncbi:MAG: hypothetical protein J6V24_02250 [Clostridia bacterium]|nr:hypothetical protein [Clostridia bacterium]MBO7403758.1 hypothetical protein [Clostridia bacterium]
MSKNACKVFVCLAVIAFIALCAAMSIQKTREAIRERDRRERERREEEQPEPQPEPQDEAAGEIG